MHSCVRAAKPGLKYLQTVEHFCLFLYFFFFNSCKNKSKVIVGELNLRDKNHPEYCLYSRDAMSWNSQKSLPLGYEGEEVLTTVLSVKLKITVSASTHFKTSSSSVYFLCASQPAAGMYMERYIQAQLWQMHKTLQIKFG